MNEQVWTFNRGLERLALRRTTGEARHLLTVDHAGTPRTYEFQELERLQRFQEDFETLLIGTGWTFVSFSPDRRSGRERRHFARLLTDRRRWWTDGLPVERAADRGRGEDASEDQLRRPSSHRIRWGF
ncbi:MAG: hypothetical protein AB7Q29_10285 [Vicinamibacterales bacterium]